MSDNAFLVDTTKCTGCRGCQVACKQWNNLPGEKTVFFGGTEYTNPKELSAITWNHVKFFDLDRSNEKQPVWTIMHKKCYHCQDANCIKICPEKAISKKDGWTVIDQNKCIGCGACVSECIYNVPGISGNTYSENSFLKKDKTYKCNACITTGRETPACVFTCPTGALTFGPRQSMLNEAEQRLSQVKVKYPKASIYGKSQFGGLRVITILKDDPEKYGLEKNPKPLEVSKIEQVKDYYHFFSLATFGIPSLKRQAYRIARQLAGNSRKTV